MFDPLKDKSNLKGKCVEMGACKSTISRNHAWSRDDYRSCVKSVEVRWPTAHKNVRCDMFYHKKSFQILETFMSQQIIVFPPPPHFPTLVGPASTGIHRASYVDCPRSCVLAIENYLESECSGEVFEQHGYTLGNARIHNTT